MKRRNLFFLLSLLFAGQYSYAQCSFSYSVNGTDNTSVVLTRKYIESWYKPTYSSSEECEKRRNQALSQNSSSVKVACTPCNCGSLNATNTEQTAIGTADFDNTRQVKSVVYTNPFDDLIDGKDEYLYKDKVMYGKHQDSLVSLTGDDAFDRAYARIGKSRALIYKNPNDLKVNMSIQKPPKLPTQLATIPKLQNKNGQWNKENSSAQVYYYYNNIKKPVYNNQQEETSIFDEETKSVAGLAVRKIRDGLIHAMGKWGTPIKISDKAKFAKETVNSYSDAAISILAGVYKSFSTGDAQYAEKGYRKSEEIMLKFSKDNL